MTAYAPAIAPARAGKRPTRRTQTTVRPLELFDEATLAGLRPSPMLSRLGLPGPRHWFTATDLFCGAGGTTTGFEAAMIDGQHIVDTLQVVNHDWLAIASHQANHAAARHFIEDITKLDASLLVKTSLLWASLECTNFSNAKGGQSRDADSRSLAEHMERYIRAVNPLYFCVENVREFMSWGPLVHKKDKYGRPMFRSVKVLTQRLSKKGEPLFSKTSGKPLTQQVVDAAGNLVFEQVPVMVPESRTKGRDFIRWKQSIEDLGYEAHHTLLNSADYGERTSRIRLFMVFAKKGLPVRWPRATHSKNGKTVGTEPWLPVRPCLDLEVKGRSIFDRVRLDKQGNVKLDKQGNPIPDPLVEKTLKRLFAGLCQYIAGSDVPTVTRQLQQLAQALISGQSGGSQQAQAQAETEWLAKRTSNPPSGKANPGASLDQPGPAVACGFHPDLVQVQARQSAQEFITKAFSGEPAHLVQGTDRPAGSLTCVDHHQLGQVVPVAEEFLSTRHHTSPESRGRSVDGPAAVVMPNDHHDLVQVQGAGQQFLTQYNGGSDECRSLSVEGPLNTITPANRFGVVQTEPASGEFLTNPGWPERCSAASTQQPGPTLIARQDKAPLSLVQTVGTGEVGFVQKYYSSGPNVTSLNDPSGSLTCTDRMALAQVEANPQQPAQEGAWLDKRYGSGQHNHQGLDAPGGALMTNEKHVLAQVEPVDGVFLDQQYGQSGPASVEDPAGSLTGIPKLNVAQTEPWIVKTDFNRVGTPLSEPSGTLTASRHYPYLAEAVAGAEGERTEGEWLLDNKFDNTGRPLSECGPTLLTGDHQYLAQTEAAPVAVEPKNWQFQEGDSETMRLIRLFLRAYNLSDVLLRMLMVKELLAIQGFPAEYQLKGSQSDMKKFIGNSVPPKMSQRITEALYEALQENNLLDRLTEYTGSLVVNKEGRLAESGGQVATAA